MAYSWGSDPEVSSEIILTGESLEASSREMADQRIIGWDVETSGLSPYQGSRIIGHAVAWRRSSGQLRSVYIPCRHESYLGLLEAPTQLDPAVVSDAMKPALEGPALKCGHNLNFDVQFALIDGLNVVGPVHDTLIAARLQDENQHSYKLSAVLERARVNHQRGWKDFIKPDIAAQQKHLRLNKKELLGAHGYKFIDVSRLGWYAVQDAAYELRLAEYQFPFCGQWGDIWAMEMELFWVGVDMARIGVPVDRQLLSDLAAEQQSVMDQLSPQIWALAGEQFEITNDRQLRRILFDKLGYPSQGTTKGRNSDALNQVDDNALWSLERNHGSEIASLVRQFNSSEKIVSTYSLGIINLCDSNGVVHGEFRQSGAKTGRASMSSPNLQNIPTRTELGRRVKAAFTTRPGKLRYCVDYCLTGDTEVITERGPVPIRTVVQDGLGVLSCSPEGRLAFKAVERAARIGTKPVVELELDEGTAVICTADHEWMRYDGSMAKTSELHLGDRLRQVRPGHCSTWNYSLSPIVQEVRPGGDRVVYHLTVADWHTFVLANGLVSGNSQIELRVLAHLSQDPLLLKVYRDGLDAHKTTAIEAFGTSGTVGGIDMRRVAKILNFGIPFGITEIGVRRNINKDLPDDIPAIDESMAAGYLEAWFKKYKGVSAWRNSVWSQAQQNGGLFWNMFGRPRRVPSMLSSKGWEYRRGQRQVVSTYVQGSAADLVKFSMVDCHKYLKSQTDCEAAMVLMVHDDLQFDMVPEGSAKTIREMIRIMENCCQHRLSVPIKVDCEYFVDHWGNKQKLEV